MKEGGPTKFPGDFQQRLVALAGGGVGGRAERSVNIWSWEQATVTGARPGRATQSLPPAPGCSPPAQGCTPSSPESQRRSWEHRLGLSPLPFQGLPAALPPGCGQSPALRDHQSLPLPPLLPPGLCTGLGLLLSLVHLSLGLHRLPLSYSAGTSSETRPSAPPPAPPPPLPPPC